MFDDEGIGRYTYYSPMGASTIDYVILREDYMISKPKLVESDHCPIKFHILNSKLKELKKIEYQASHKMSRHVMRLKKCYVP